MEPRNTLVARHMEKVPEVVNGNSIGVHLAHAHAQVDELHELAVKVEQRFSVALRPVPPLVQARTEASDRAATCEMMANVESLNEQLKRLRGRLHDLLERCEL